MSRSHTLQPIPLFFTALILLATCLAAAGAVKLTELLHNVNDSVIGPSDNFELPAGARQMHCYSDGTVLLFGSLPLGYEDPKRFLHPIVTGDPYLGDGEVAGSGSTTLLVRFHPYNQSIVWATQIARHTTTVMDVDDAGNVYVTGSSNFDLSTISKYNWKGMLVWRKNHGSINLNHDYFFPWAPIGRFYNLRIAEQGRVIVVAAVVNTGSPLLPVALRTENRAVLVRISAESGAVLGDVIVLPVSVVFDEGPFVPNLLENMIVSTDSSAVYLAESPVRTIQNFGDVSTPTIYRVRLSDGNIVSRQLPSSNTVVRYIRISALTNRKTSASDAGVFVAFGQYDGAYGFNRETSIACFRLLASLEYADWATGSRPVPSIDQFILYIPPVEYEMEIALVLENGTLAVLVNTNGFQKVFETFHSKRVRRLCQEGSCPAGSLNQHPFTYPLVLLVDAAKNLTVSKYEVGPTRLLKNLESFAMCPSSDKSALFLSTSHVGRVTSPLGPKLFAEFAVSQASVRALPLAKPLLSSPSAEDDVLASSYAPQSDMDTATPSDVPMAKDVDLSPVTTEDDLAPLLQVEPSSDEVTGADGDTGAVTASELLRNIRIDDYASVEAAVDQIHCFPDGSLLISTPVSFRNYYDPSRFVHTSVIGDPYLGGYGHIQLLVRFHPSNDSVVWAAQIGYKFERFVATDDAIYLYFLGPLSPRTDGPMIAKYDSSGAFVWKRYYGLFNDISLLRIADEGGVIVMAGVVARGSEASTLFLLALEKDKSQMVVRIDTESGGLFGSAVVLPTKSRSRFDPQFSEFFEALAVSADGGTAYIGVHNSENEKVDVDTCTVHRVRFSDGDVVSRELPVAGVHSVLVEVAGGGETRKSNSGVFVMVNRNQAPKSRGGKYDSSIEIYRLRSSLEDAEWATGLRPESTPDTFVLRLPSRRGGLPTLPDPGMAIQHVYMSKSGVLAVLLHTSEFEEAFDTVHNKTATIETGPKSDLNRYNFVYPLILYVDGDKNLSMSKYEIGGDRLLKKFGALRMCLGRDETSAFLTGMYEVTPSTLLKKVPEFAVPQASKSGIISKAVIS